jgi:hypothetical protein
MKKFNFFFVSCLLATSMFFMAGCETDNSDPSGAVQVTMRNGNNGRTIVSPDGASGSFFIGNNNNFYSWTGRVEFATVGKVNGLGNVTRIPTSGWANQVAVVPGQGYVVAFRNWNTEEVTYLRMYVLSWVEASTGGIIGARITYQYPFVP